MRRSHAARIALRTPPPHRTAISPAQPPSPSKTTLRLRCAACLSPACSMLHTHSCTQHTACCMSCAARCTFSHRCARIARRTPNGATRSRPAGTRPPSHLSTGDLVMSCSLHKRLHTCRPSISALPPHIQKRQFRTRTENMPSPPRPCRTLSRTAPLPHVQPQQCIYHTPMEPRVELPGHSQLVRCVARGLQRVRTASALQEHTRTRTPVGQA